jgi:tRNA (cmo5U34)-methyltransferase
MRDIAHHFNSEAGIFDARVVRIVPQYRDMLDALVAALPFPSQRPVRIVDLGCGTGTVSWLVKQRFPNAKVHCVDLSPRMLALAAHKLAGGDGITFEQADLQTYAFRGTYDAVVSSLALHHLEPGAGKARVFRRIWRALAPGGVLANADIIRSADRRCQRVFLGKWGEFILCSYSEEALRENHARYLREDRPAVLREELAGLERIGFMPVEVFWKYYNFATYAAYKPAAPARSPKRGTRP